MTYIESPSHPLIKFRKWKYKVTTLQVEDYYTNELHNKSFRLIGSVSDISSSFLYIKIQIEYYVPSYSSEEQYFEVRYNFEKKLDSYMINLMKNDLVVCTGILKNYLNGYEFDLLNISKYTGKTYEDIEWEQKKRRRTTWKYCALIALMVGVIFSLIGDSGGLIGFIFCLIALYCFTQDG